MNALESTLVSVSGRVMEVRARQRENALLPTLVTVLGRVMEVRPEQP